MKTIVKTIDTKLNLFSDGTWNFNTDEEKSYQDYCRLYPYSDKEFIPGRYYEEHCGLYLYSDNVHHYFMSSSSFADSTPWSDEYKDNLLIRVSEDEKNEILRNDIINDPKLNGLVATKILTADGLVTPARYCAFLRLTNKYGVSYDDWFLPSLKEMCKVLEIKGQFNAGCVLMAHMLTDNCWTSTEESTDKAWAVDFNDYLIKPYDKRKNRLIRPIRKVAK